MKTEIYVQARMGSTRLPGKVMLPVLNKTLLEYLLERLADVKEADTIAILTTTNPADDNIVSFCKERNILCYRGSEENVLERYFEVAKKRKPDAIIRITSDCPLIDPDIVDKTIKAYKENFPSYDYVSNSLEHTFPRGLDVEVFSYTALEETFKNAIREDEKEHVTPYIYRHPEKFKLKNIYSDQDLSSLRLTVDTKEDFKLIRLILEHLYPQKPHFRLRDILELLRNHPNWIEINANIQQKKLKT